jgi:hypothetical protein
MAFNAGDIEATLTLDRTPFQDGLDRAKEEADSFSSRDFRATLSADNDPFTESLRFAQDRGAEFGDEHYQASLAGDNDPFIESLRFAEARADEWAASHYTATLDAKTDTSQAKEGLTELETASKDTADKIAKDMGQSGGMGGSLLVSAIVAAIPLATGVITAGLGAIFIGIAAWADHSVQSVHSSFVQLENDALSVAHNAAASLSGPLTQSIQSLDSNLVNLGPTFATAFRLAQPDVMQLTYGIEGLINNTMPGINNELRQSEQVMAAFGSFLSSTGSGLSGFFTVLSQGATAQATSMRSWGAIVQTILPDVATLANDLTQLWAQNAGPIVQLFTSLGSTITQLASGAMPAINSELSGLVGAANLVLGVLKPLDGVIGTGIGLWADYATSLKLANLVLPSLGKGVSALSGPVGGLTSALGGSDAQASKVSKSISSIGTSMAAAGPYVAVGATVIEGSLNLIQDQADKTYGSISQLQQGFLAGGQDAVKAQQGIDNASASLDKANNSVMGNIVNWGSWLFPIAGVTNLLAKGTIPTMSDVTNGLSSVQKAQALYNQAVVQFGSNSQQAITASANYAQAQKTAAQATQNTAAATGLMATNSATGTSGVIAFSGATANLITNLTALGATTATDSSRIQALTAIIEGIVNPTGDAAAALLAIGSAVDGVTTALSSATGPLEDSNGKFDALGKRGNATAKAVETAGTAMATYVSQAEAAGIPTSEMTGHLTDMYNTLEKSLLPAFKGNKAAVDDYLSQLGVAPPTTMLQASNTQAAEISAAFDLLKGKIDAVPNNKQVIVTALSTQAQQQLTELGLTVTKLPNGEIEITANNASAMASLQQMISTTNGSIGTTHIYAEDKKAMDVLQAAMGAVNSAFGTSSIRANSGLATSSLQSLMNTINNSFAATKIGADTGSASASVGGFVNRVNNTTATVRVQAQVVQTATSILGSIFGHAQGGSIVGHALGGSVVGRPGYADGGTTPTVVGENGPELIWPSYQSFVTTSAQSSAIASQAASAFGGGNEGPVSLSATTVNQLAQAFAQSVAQAIAGSQLNVDGSGVATLVNNRNYHNSRR